MKKLDFYYLEDIKEFALNYEDYKNKALLPIEITNRIELVRNHFNDGMLTKSETSNQIIDIVISFMSDIDSKYKIKRRI